MDPQVDYEHKQVDEIKPPGFSWHSLPEIPDRIPEMHELLELFREADNELKQLVKAVDIVSKNMRNVAQPEWLNSAEVMMNLKISKRTLQKYRDTGVITFSRLNGKIYYRRKEIIALLERNDR